jgi:hypothetical protein
LSADVVAGRHDVKLSLGRSSVRAVAEAVSLLAVLLTLLMVMVNRRRRWWPTIGVAVVVAGVAAGLAWLMPVAEAEGPVTFDYDFMPYPHYNPDGLSFGKSVLTSAAVTEDVVEAGQSLFVNLVWEEPWAGWLVEAALVTPAEVVPDLGAPDVRATAEQNVGDQGQLVLDIPEAVPTGLYFVRLRVLDGETEIRPTSGDSDELGTTYLGPVRIRGRGTFRDMPDPPVGRMGDVILHAVSPVQQVELLEVRMYWETSTLLAYNYKTSVRLVDSAGDLVVQNDKEPLYGYYPTSAWVPGEQILDKRWLEIPPGTEAGDDYLVEVVVYEDHSGEEIGSGRVSGVRIEPWAVETGAGQ